MHANNGTVIYVWTGVAFIEQPQQFDLFTLYRAAHVPGIQLNED